MSDKGIVYGWGDAESGKIGRKITPRNEQKNVLKMEKVGAKNVTDIFCGKHHSFYIDKDHKVYSFGLNNHG